MVTGQVVGGLANGVEHRFEVRAAAGPVYGASSVVRVTPGPPPAPEGFVALPGVNAVTLRWAAPAGASVSGYQIRYHKTGATPPSWTDALSVGAGTLDHTERGLTNGSPHTFEVRAVNAVGGGPPSRATATPVPAAPANLTAAPGDRQVELSWDDPMDGEINGYEIRYYSGGGPSAPVWEQIPGSGAGTTEYTAAGLANGTSYTIEVRARAGMVHGDSSVVTAVPRACPAIGVSGLRDTTVTVGQALSMTARVPEGEATYTYGLSVDPESGSELSIDEESGVISGAPTAAGAYTVTVRVTDAGGCMGEGVFTVRVCPGDQPWRRSRT